MTAVAKRQPMPKAQQEAIKREIFNTGWKLMAITKTKKGITMTTGYRAIRGTVILNCTSLDGLLEIFVDGEPDKNKVAWQDIPGLTVPLDKVYPVSDVDFEEGNG